MILMIIILIIIGLVWSMHDVQRILKVYLFCKGLGLDEVALFEHDEGDRGDDGDEPLVVVWAFLIAAQHVCLHISSGFPPS